MVGRQAPALGLSGTVEVEPLELLLSGRDPVSGTPLGRELVDRVTRDGRVVKAVSGFDATFSAPKSLSVWWGLTGDRRLLEAHDVAVDGSARASGAVRVDNPHPPRWWPVASGYGRVDDGDVPADDVAGR